jgi:TetR/AcrR family transcriptional regulator, mexJK operon transcriptional repressor
MLRRWRQGLSIDNVKKEKATPVKTEPRRSPGRPKATTAADIDRALIRVARHFFVAKGYGPTSITEIAKAANASKGTVYARFASKAHLFKAIIDEQIQRTWVGVRQYGPKPKTLQAMLKVFAEQAFNESLSPDILALNRLMISEAERFPELAEAAHERGQIGLKHITQMIREYAELENIPCRHPEVAADIYLKLTKGWYSEVLLRGRPVEAGEVKQYVQYMVKWFIATRATW